jgi:TonB family protein
VIVRPVPLTAPLLNLEKTNPDSGEKPSGSAERKSASLTTAKSRKLETGKESPLPPQSDRAPAPLSLDQSGLLRIPDRESAGKEPRSQIEIPASPFDPYRAPKSSSIQNLIRKQDREWLQQKQQRSHYRIGAGEETVAFIDDDKFEYGNSSSQGGTDITPWARQVIREIMESWKSISGPDSPGTAWAKVGFMPDGSLRAVEIIRSSGNLLFDNQVKQALLINVPYPPLPKNLGLSPLTVTIEFNHEK